jgi:hypothetical protein
MSWSLVEDFPAAIIADNGVCLVIVSLRNGKETTKYVQT